MGIFSRFKNVSKKSSFQMITDVGNGFYAWNGKLYQSDIVRSCIRPKTKANLNVTVKRYEDHETDDQMTKAIMMADGKVVDNNSLVEVIQKNL